MKGKIRSLIILSIAMTVVAAAAFGQPGGRETYTGTIVSFGSGFNTRTFTGSFTLVINRQTSDERAQHLLGVLQEGSQDSLLRELRQEDVGTFSVGSRVGPRLNVVRETMVDGKKRIFAVFERWKQFGELRGGYRSLDYPFSVIEIFVDPATGKGEGTFIAAAQIKWKQDKKTGQYQIEIENFGTYPSRLLGVTQRGRRTM